MKLPLVYHKPIEPASGERFAERMVKPVTPDELGGYYLTVGLRNFQQKDGLIDLKILREDLDRWHNQNLKPGESSPDLSKHNFGPVLWLLVDFLRAENWKEALAEIRKRKLYVFDCWGIIPGLKEGIKGGPSWIIPEDVQRYITKHLGKYFLGWDNGEEDGRWFWQSMRIWPAPVDRKDSYRYFYGWFTPFVSDLQNYVNALCGLTYPHYFARMAGHRLIGAEFLQALPSVPMWAAWVRGAARQYQLLWMAGISIWNNFGYKTFEEDAFKGDSSGKNWIGIGNPQMQTGPDRGPSLSLMRKVWYILFVYGVNIETFEASQFFRERHLSPLGKLQLDATSFCVKNEKRRGVQHNPVGAIVDLYAGWAPPRHLYSDSFYTVWGGIPYERGDHQIDLFFREIYPGYQNCPYFRDESGFLTPTPYGDIVDVLLSETSKDILSHYQVVVVLGEISVKDKLLTNLSDFVKKGGKIIWSLSQLSEGAKKLSGIISVGKKIYSRTSRNLQNGKTYQEAPFTFPEINHAGTEVLLESETGQPLMIGKSCGKGEIITILAPFGLTDKIKEPHPLTGGDPARDVTTISYFDKPLGSPYRFLQGIKEIVFPYLSSFNLVEVKASKDPPRSSTVVERPVFIQYITNVTNQPDKLVLMLVNNEPFPVYALVKTKGAKIKKATDLLHKEKNMLLKDGCLPVTLFPSNSADFNIYIVELKLDKPVVRFQN